MENKGPEDNFPWYPAEPDRETVFEFDGRDLKVLVMLSIQNLADSIKRNLDRQEVKLLIHLLTDEPEESRDNPGEPGDGEPDDGEPDESGSGDGPGDSGGDGDDYDPYGENDADTDGAAEGDQGREEGEKDVPYAPAVFAGGGDGTPKREQKDYPDDILAALAQLGLDPSKL
jgi:hypothetical protein